ncbi:UDP-4-amino-4,6-dideoxy-N-acetyl-beta-L-altrosamine transaminase [Oceaniovalibus sp. ACAM 378]|uniref:UDP-4-amino-4, 6-dideoxy-N-acetyl-beta-L-altrosamine transaminase n=1 Tax=Oceaniovalibus sp. ACAM 378 TaxID=2599923 RepID=UPI0011DADFF9|nr:UDP-4-amino-4,6-dideoxy-N-acetyl-beta-L-altrosamine transaminase [Oceaniovalibus sp. ACAM 378]TYB87594.1 UDP-4-amino-4,6-dideoxy-N-acetyl-beta-L-altrosamine transaminase [Oceaniovalibus sp. ACAM 378]
MIPYGRQDITQGDIDAVVDVLRSEFLTQGPQVPLFEKALCAATGATHAVAVNSATSALHIACLALGLGRGGLLWTSPNTFVATANVGHLCGADVDFVDIDPDTFNMSASALRIKLHVAHEAGKLPDILIVVHMCGQSADMATIGALAREFGVRVIEDASHAIGGRYQEHPVGFCEHSDICCFSFHPVKIVTTAEGGASTTNDAELAARMERLRSHGITRDPALMRGEPDGDWYYQQIELGLNYRMTELQAALGVAQMARLEDYVARRNALAERYDRLLSDLPLRRPGRLSGVLSAFHLYVIRVDPARRKAVFDHMRAAGILVNVHYIPVHTQPYWRDHGFASGDFPAAEAYYAAAISIPLYATLSDEQQDRVVAELARALA